MRHFFKIIISFILIIVIATAISGYIFVRKFDLNKYRTMIEAQVLEHTGRELKINGDAHLGISLLPTLIIDDITLANASWSEQPDMLKLQSLKVQIAVLPLLKKEIVIKEFSLIEPQIYLEKAANGMTNWDFSKAEKVAVSQQTLGFAQLESISAANLIPELPLPSFIKQISLKSISIENGFVQYIDAATKQKQEAEINNLTLNMDSLASPINVNIDAVYQKNPIKASVILGSFNDFFAENKPYTVNLKADAYNIKTTVEGTVLNVMKDISYDLTLKASSPAGNFGLSATQLETTLKGTTENIRADIQKLLMADNQISGTLQADISKKIPQINANLKSPRINLTTLQNKKSAQTFEVISSAQATNLVANTPIPYALLKSINGNLHLSVKQLIINEAITANNVLLKAAVSNGVLTVKPLNLDFGSGNIDLNTVLNANTQTLSVVLNSKNVLLQDLHKEFLIDGKNDFGILSGGKTLLNATLTSQGNTFRQMVQNLKGQTVILLSDSKIQTGSLQFLTNNFITQLLNTLKVDTIKSQDVNLQCAVVRADFGNGKINFPEGIAIQSDRFTMSSTGQINLLNDNINFNLTPAFNMDTGIAQALSSLIKIQGTLERPQITLDDKQALKTMVGIATTGGIAYLGSQTLTSNNSPCYSALKETAYQNLVPQPSAASIAQQNAIDETKAAYKETKKAIKQEFKNLKQNAKDILNIFKGN